MAESDSVENERIAQELGVDPSDLGKILCDFNGLGCGQLDPDLDREMLDEFGTIGSSACQYFSRREDGTPCSPFPVCALNDYDYQDGLRNRSSAFDWRPHLGVECI